MPRRAVDEMTVATLNKLVREIDEGKAKPRLIRVEGVGGWRSTSAWPAAGFVDTKIGS